MLLGMPLALFRVSNLPLPDSQILLTWFKQQGRDLPWRKDRTLYSTLVSEFMLQQTQVSVVIPYFERWMQQLPTMQSVADATETEILTLWAGLGYYNRARRLQQLCKILCTNPPQANLSFWLDLPGIGDYTAQAVLSMFYGLPYMSWDGNLIRIFCRLLATNNPDFDAIKLQWLSNMTSNNCKVINEALMDLGATICTPKAPKCTICPFVSNCQGKLQPETFPNKKVAKTTNFEITRGIYTTLDSVAMIQCNNKASSLFGLWELPEIVNHTLIGIPQATLRRSISNHRILEKIYKLTTIPVGASLIPIKNLSIIAMNGPHKKYLISLYGKP
jgi:A/G-specific adenine glycosylase